jgi:hypothetical protein
MKNNESVAVMDDITHINILNMQNVCVEWVYTKKSAVECGYYDAEGACDCTTCSGGGDPPVFSVDDEEHCCGEDLFLKISADNKFVINASRKNLGVLEIMGEAVPGIEMAVGKAMTSLASGFFSAIGRKFTKKRHTVLLDRSTARFCEGRKPSVRIENSTVRADWDRISHHIPTLTPTFNIVVHTG